MEELAAVSIEEAAREAALADGLMLEKHSDPSQDRKQNLRRGKWTAEEESYANRLIVEFKLGTLPLTDGTTLRTFLSKLLNCDPMRISKKFVGQNCIGKVHFFFFFSFFFFQILTFKCKFETHHVADFHCFIYYLLLRLHSNFTASVSAKTVGR